MFFTSPSFQTRRSLDACARMKDERAVALTLISCDLRAELLGFSYTYPVLTEVHRAQASN